MFAWIKKHPKCATLLWDMSILPGMLLCGWITDRMLTTDKPCSWNQFGGQCITCGGTHFVNDLCHFRIGAAMQDNLFLFALTVYLLLSVIFFNLWKIFDLRWFKKALQRMYNIPVLIAWLVMMMLFLILRNIPLIMQICQALLSYL